MKPASTRWKASYNQLYSSVNVSAVSTSFKKCFSIAALFTKASKYSERENRETSYNQLFSSVNTSNLSTDVNNYISIVTLL